MGLTPEKRSWLIQFTQTQLSRYGSDSLNRLSAGSVAREQHIKVVEIVQLQSLVEIINLSCRGLGAFMQTVSSVVTYTEFYPPFI